MTSVSWIHFWPTVLLQGNSALSRKYVCTNKFLCFQNCHHQWSLTWSICFWYILPPKFSLCWMAAMPLTFAFCSSSLETLPLLMLPYPPLLSPPSCNPPLITGYLMWPSHGNGGISHPPSLLIPGVAPLHCLSDLCGNQHQLASVTTDTTIPTPAYQCYPWMLSVLWPDIPHDAYTLCSSTLTLPRPHPHSMIP